MDSEICALPENYVPSENEEFMNDLQREYFRRKLIKWKQSLSDDIEEVVHYLNSDDYDTVADFVDKASSETDLYYELRTKERAEKLVDKIDVALLKIENKTYGYCEETGEKIGLKRLEARPVATLCIKAQERHEQQEKMQKF